MGSDPTVFHINFFHEGIKGLWPMGSNVDPLSKDHIGNSRAKMIPFFKDRHPQKPHPTISGIVCVDKRTNDWLTVALNTIDQS